ncbi:MAG: hypothetical protein EHM66_01800, partial [Deltaproteobacteria bacterium]
MKRIMMSAMVLVILLVSIGGCFVPWHGDGRDGRGGGHDRDGRYDRDRGPDRGGGHDRDGGRR